uniref:trypsin n=1 Tax=Phlebotomus papatasi TaxID=29031 RepID=A0A1B0DPI1_PHLPP
MEVDISEIPYQISLQYSGRHDCGGTIISPFYIITAGHCTYEFAVKKSDRFTIRAGSNFKYKGGVLVTVIKIIPHPKYRYGISHDYDFTICKLIKPLELGKNIQAVKLPKQDEMLHNDSVFLISGWGMLGEKYHVSKVLRAVYVPIYPRHNCFTHYKAYDLVTSRMICAAYDEGGMDACKLDSGGPLVKDGILYGVTSWGLGCGRKGFPGVYSRVASVRKWIKKVADKFSSNKKKHFRHDRLQRGICINLCQELMDHFDPEEQMSYFQEEFPTDNEVWLDPRIFRKATHYRKLYDQLINQCINHELITGYDLVAFSQVEYCVTNHEILEYDFLDICFFFVLVSLVTTVFASTYLDRRLKKTRPVEEQTSDHYRMPLQGPVNGRVTFSLLRNWYRLMSGPRRIPIRICGVFMP